MEVATHVATFTTAACAVVITVSLLRPPTTQPPPPDPPVPDFATYHVAGQRIGPASAPVTIVEFSDFQCPSCRRLHTALQEIRARYPVQVSLLYRHYPLESIHPHAASAAIASECAAAQGRFEEFHDLLFAEQPSIGQRPYAEFALQAGITDTAAFARCLTDPALQTRLAEDRAAADRLGVRGTPTALVNSQRFSGSWPVSVIDSMVQTELRAVAGR